MVYLTALGVVLIITPICLADFLSSASPMRQKRAKSAEVKPDDQIIVDKAHFEFKGPEVETAAADNAAGTEEKATSTQDATTQPPSGQNITTRKYVMRKGHVSGDGDLCVKTMTLDEAKIHCDALPDCHSFTFMGDRWAAMNGEPQEIFFKNKYDIDASDWTTYVPVSEVTDWDEEERLKEQRKRMFMSSQVQERKSEELPAEEWTPDAPIRITVGSTFDNITLNREKDVVMNIYASWCGHCQQFKKQYRGVARKLAHVSTLEFAHMDGTLNTVRIPIKGFPSILLFRAGSEVDDPPEEYRGNRSPDDLMHWIQDNAAHPFSQEPTGSEVDGFLNQIDSPSTMILMDTDENGAPFLHKEEELWALLNEVNADL